MSTTAKVFLALVFFFLAFMNGPWVLLVAPVAAFGGWSLVKPIIDWQKARESDRFDREFRKIAQQERFE